MHFEMMRFGTFDFNQLTLLIWLLIGLALIFDFLNGFHDTANSIATVVSTRVLSPRWAVVWAAFFNFIAFLFFGLHVATTIGKGIVDPSVIDVAVVLSALVGAIAWDLFTWWWGIPSSSSHALIGGLAGAAIAKGGAHLLDAPGLIKIAISIVLSPVLGLVLAFGLMTAVFWIFRRSTAARVDHWFRRGQLLSAALYSLGHGGNDAQKTMGIIAVLLFATGHLGPTFYVPLWVVLACHAAMALGTLSGGWRIVRTMGLRITKLKPVGGFCAETGGAITLFAATSLGIPVSTTHTITGAIVGVGAVTRLSAIRWGVAGRIVWAWVFTIPASAFISAVTWSVVHSLVS
jgi:PiT family inorganic phosphate transporter